MLLPRVLQNVISVHHECVSLDENGPHYGVDHLKTINQSSLIFFLKETLYAAVTIQKDIKEGISWMRLPWQRAKLLSTQLHKIEPFPPPARLQ